MTNEDKEDCLTILKEMKNLCRMFSEYRKDPVSSGFVYGIDQSIDVLTEIIENKPLKIERMF